MHRMLNKCDANRLYEFVDQLIQQRPCLRCSTARPGRVLGLCLQALPNPSAVLCVRRVLTVEKLGGTTLRQQPHCHNTRCRAATTVPH